MKDCRCEEEKMFTPKEEIQHIVDWIKEYFVKNGPDSKALIGISGGQESTIAAALCARALGPDKVIGVLMPQGFQHDIEDAREVCKGLGIQSYEINIDNACAELYQALDKGIYDGVNTTIFINRAITTNLPARIRMTTLYAVAAELGGRVCNTCNRSEIFVGYSTKYGDRAGDFAPIAGYTVTELLAIGEVLHQEMGIPNELIYKAPSDGMCGTTDEDNLGFTYKELDDYILNNIKPDYETLKKITQANARNQHKIRDIKIPECTSLNRRGRIYF